MLNKVKIILLMGSFFASLLFPSIALAASNVIYVTPQSTTVNQGANFSVEIRIDPNTSINAVQADLSYNSSIVQFNSLSLGAFTLCAQQSGGGGLVQVACSTSSSVSTDSLVATINFTALGGGTSGLDLSNYNAVSSSTSTYTNPTASNGSVTINGTSSPTPSPSPSTTSTSTKKYSYPSTTSSPSSSTPPQTPQQALPIKISNINSHFYYSNGEIVISCNQNVSGILKIGTDPKNLSTNINGSTNSSTETFKLNPSDLIPGSKYYYQFVLSGPNGASYTSSVKSFQTKGLNVSLLVLGSNDKNVSNLKVYIDSNKNFVTTNNNGVLILTNMSPGVHKINYEINNKIYSSTFFVENTVISTGNNYQTANAQNLAVILSSYRQKSKNYAWVWIIIALVIIIGLVIYILSKVIKVKKLVNIFDLHKDLKIIAPRI